MTMKLTGREVADTIKEKILPMINRLKEAGISPCLGILRVGEDPSAGAYEMGAKKTGEKIGVKVESFVLPEDVSQKEVLRQIRQINEDKNIHGLLIFRPLPKHLDEEKICSGLIASKDVDGITSQSMSKVFAGTGEGFPPCTPVSCMEMLKHYGIPVEGKKVIVIGRSLVVGRPIAMMLMEANATVTICHSKTQDVDKLTKAADIIVVATGKPKTLCKEMVARGQVVIDVGINMDREGKLCGDVSYEDVYPIVKGITPVPGGVGTVTSAVLMQHVVLAAVAQNQN